MCVYKTNKYLKMQMALTLPIFIILFFSTILTAGASDFIHTQLERNSTLEISDINRELLQTKNIQKKNLSHETQDLSNDKIKSKSRELEGVFISNMIEPMFPSGKESNLYGGGNAQNVFRSMMIQEYGKIFADAGGVGLAKSIEKQIEK